MHYFKKHKCKIYNSYYGIRDFVPSKQVYISFLCAITIGVSNP